MIDRLRFFVRTVTHYKWVNKGQPVGTCTVCVTQTFLIENNSGLCLLTISKNLEANVVSLTVHLPFRSLIKPPCLKLTNLKDAQISRPQNSKKGQWQRERERERNRAREKREREMNVHLWLVIKISLKWPSVRGRKIAPWATGSQMSSSADPLPLYSIIMCPSSTI